MHISKFRVSNYKSFLDSSEVEFKPGFNIVTGQNSAGKTALLEALSLHLTPKPHRSVRTMPVPGILPEETSTVRATFLLTGEELLDWVQNMRFTYWFPAPNDVGETQASMDRQLKELVRQPELRFGIRLEWRGGNELLVAQDQEFFGFYRVKTS